MGLFGKVFDKKECSICGGEIGLLGNRKLDDGNLCKDCAKKLSPWFEERRHSTVEQIRQQLAYREQNKAAVQAFHVTREFAGDDYHVYIDDSQGKFAIARNMNVETNPDIVDLSQVTTCRLDIRQDRDEEKYRDEEGKMQSFVPPRYTYSYDYYIKIGINSPWFDDMDFKLNSFSVRETDRSRIVQIENMGNQIVAALSGTAQNIYGQQSMANQGMYNQQAGMNQGMYNQQPMMNQGMYNQQAGMNQGMYSQQPGMNQGMYSQQPGMSQGMYGQQPGMSQGMYGQQPGVNQGMYNQQSGMAQGMAEAPGVWICSCGAHNTGKFCEYCGNSRP